MSLFISLRQKVHFYGHINENLKRLTVQVIASIGRVLLSVGLIKSRTKLQRAGDNLMELRFCPFEESASNKVTCSRSLANGNFNGQCVVAQPQLRESWGEPEPRDMDRKRNRSAADPQNALRTIYDIHTIAVVESPPRGPMQGTKPIICALARHCGTSSPSETPVAGSLPLDKADQLGIVESGEPLRKIQDWGGFYGWLRANCILFLSASAPLGKYQCT